MQAVPARLWTLAVALVCCLGVLAACGSNDRGKEAAGGSARATDAAGAATWSPARADCINPAYPKPLAVTTTAKDQRDYLVGVVACTSEQQPGSVWLHNVGGEVWTLQDGGGRPRWLDWSLESVVFRETFDGPLLLLPEDVMLLSGAPDKVSWSLNKAYTVAWETQAEGVDRVRSYSQDVWAAALRRKETPARVALASCTSSAYRFADTYAQDPDAFQKDLAAELARTTDGAKGCAASWKRAWDRGLDPTQRYLDTVGRQYRLLSGFQQVPKITID